MRDSKVEAALQKLSNFKAEPMRLPIKYQASHHSIRKAAREEYARLQGGKCYFCGELLSGKPSPKVMAKPISIKLFPPHFFDWPIHLHHDHETDLTLGAVHCQCNAVLWQYHGK